MSFESNVRKVVPYVPGEQPKETDIIKLNTNECPYPPTPAMKRIMEECSVDDLRLYPDPNATELVEAIAEYYNLSKEEVFVGVGSDDVIAMAFLTFFNGKDPILFPDITYSFYDVWADLFRIPYTKKPLDENFLIKQSDYFVKNGGIIFPNPNAPTGNLVTLEFIEEILKKNQDVVVMVDEAYIDFGGISALPLIKKYENLLVVQTMSKSRAMAGARIGFAMGNKKLIQYLNDVKFSYNSYTMSRPILKLGVEAIKDKEYFRKITSDIIKTRETTAKKLRALGFEFADSYSNFLFVTHKNYDAKELLDMLKEHKIYVRYFAKERIDQYLRITIGTEDEMKRLIEVFTQYMK